LYNNNYSFDQEKGQEEIEEEKIEQVQNGNEEVTNEEILIKDLYSVTQTNILYLILSRHPFLHLLHHHQCLLEEQ